MYGFSGYNQIRIHPDDQENTAFVKDWGVFVAVTMMFRLTVDPTTFQHIITKIFGEGFRVDPGKIKAMIEALTL